MRQTYSFDSSPFQDGQQAFIGPAKVQPRMAIAATGGRLVKLVQRP
jgi:hypothetical protein